MEKESAIADTQKDIAKEQQGVEISERTTDDRWDQFQRHCH